jgi:hypothetical protein
LTVSEIVPAVGERTPQRIFTSVDFPEPFFPVIAKDIPSVTSKVTFL